MTQDRTRHILSATADDGDCVDAFPGEILVAPDGRYLGDFGSVIGAPFGLEYPAGWTNGTWYQMPAAKVERNACVDTDCRGTHLSNRISQRYPDELITPADAGLFDFWDHAIMPAHYVGVDGCTKHFDLSFNCSDGVRFYNGLVQPNPASQPGLEAPAEWPLVPFAVANPSSRIRVVADSTGPDDCIAGRAALEVDFSGNGLEGAVFLGDGGGFDTSSPANGYSGGERSATGWTISEGSCWTIRFWVKAVPDADGFVCDTYHIRTRTGFWPFPYSEVTTAGAVSLALTDDWQEYFRTFVATGWLGSEPEPMTNAPLSILTFDTNPIPGQTRPGYARKGRVHIKQVHVYPCRSGVHVFKHLAFDRL